MKVILLDDVKKLGSKGQVIEVSDGYGRNYLLPKGLGVEASETRLKELKEKGQQAEKKKEKEDDKAFKLQARLDKQTVTVKAKCGEGGKLFGAVTSKEIADAINAQFKIDIDKKKIEIKDPIRHLGEYAVKVKIHPSVQADITVIVQETK
ncbi:MAG: 50S ribosomal protein L9 [Ignavibacteriales bacterium]